MMMMMSVEVIVHFQLWLLDHEMIFLFCVCFSFCTDVQITS